MDVVTVAPCPPCPEINFMKPRLDSTFTNNEWTSSAHAIHPQPKSAAFVWIWKSANINLHLTSFAASYCGYCSAAAATTTNPNGSAGPCSDVVPVSANDLQVRNGGSKHNIQFSSENHSTLVTHYNEDCSACCGGKICMSILFSQGSAVDPVSHSKWTRRIIVPFEIWLTTGQ